MAVVGLGPRQTEVPAENMDIEDVDSFAQNVRAAAAMGTKLLQRAKVKNILLDDFDNAEGETIILSMT